MAALTKRIDEQGFVLMVSPPRNDPEMVRAAFENGADAVKVHLNVEHRASGTTFGSWADERAGIGEILEVATGPVGVMPGAEVVPTPAEMVEIVSAGITFMDVYQHHMPAWMLQIPLTRMIAVGHDHDLAHVRALGPLGMDVLEASIIHPDGYGQALTVADLAAYRALVEATDKPVVVPSQRALVPEDVPALRAAGVRGLLLGTLALGDEPEQMGARLAAFAAARGPV